MAGFEENIQDIEARIGYTFRDPSLLKQAFTRESYVNEINRHVRTQYLSNEVLEFFGDAVLSCGIVSFFAQERTERYEHGIRTSLCEGDFSNIRSKLSDKANLSRRAKELGLTQFFLLGEGDEKMGIAEEASVAEDLFESIVGAIYLDCDMDMHTVIRVLAGLLDVGSYLYAAPPIQSYKNALQEFCQDKSRRMPPPVYQKVGESGPDHKKEYVCACLIDGVEYARGTGKNLRAAETAAAEQTLLILKEKSKKENN